MYIQCKQLIYLFTFNILSRTVFILKTVLVEAGQLVDIFVLYILYLYCITSSLLALFGFAYRISLSRYGCQHGRPGMQCLK